MGHLNERLSAFVDGELDPADHDKVLSHLAACESCQFEAEMLRRLKRRLCGMDTPAPSMDFVGRLSALTAAPSRAEPPDDDGPGIQPERHPDGGRPAGSAAPPGRPPGVREHRPGNGGAFFERLRAARMTRGARYGLAGACMAAVTLGTVGLSDPPQGGAFPGVEARPQAVAPADSDKAAVPGFVELRPVATDPGMWPHLQP